MAEKAQPVDDQGNEQGSKGPEPVGKDNVEPMAEDLTEASLHVELIYTAICTVLPCFP